MVTSSRSAPNGFSMKSTAPRRVASAPTDALPCAEIITTGSASSIALIRVSASRPSIPGILMSRKTMSGDSRWMAAMPSSADAADAYS